jgi:hypothetical protein
MEEVMSTKTAATYVEVLQAYADEYFSESGKETATAKEIAAWAIETERWEAPANLILKRCQDDFAKALREQYFKDRHGRSIRAKHVARIKQGDRQLHLWGDIRRISRNFIQNSFQLRREQIVGDCRQLNRDKDYWNESHSDEEPLQLCFDFTDDVEEGEFPTEYPPKKPR